MGRIGRALVGPLGRGATYRRGVHLLLGAVLLLPYAGLAVLFAAYRGAGDPVSFGVLVALAVVAGTGVALVPGVRVLEVAAARALLDADLPDPPPTGSWAGRRRSAGWLVLSMAAGAVTVLVLLVAVPTAVTLLLAPWRAVAPLPTGPAAWWGPPAALLVVGLLLHAVAAAGAGLARLAPRLLGPPPRERLEAELAAARAEARAHAHRTRLARELHDSVGHALTVTVVQAEAAARVLHRDPAFAARALAAVADAGRAALADLDHALGVLRGGPDGPGGDGAERATVPDLRDVAALAARSGADLELDGEPRALPVVVSREAYRIVQEALTNAVRHGSGAATVRVAMTAGAVSVEVTNPAPGGRPGARGRGLAGLRERVDVLGGRLDAGPDGAVWRVAARIPVEGP